MAGGINVAGRAERRAATRQPNPSAACVSHASTPGRRAASASRRHRRTSSSSRNEATALRACGEAGPEGGAVYRVLQGRGPHGTRACSARHCAAHRCATAQQLHKADAVGLQRQRHQLQSLGELGEDQSCRGEGGAGRRRRGQALPLCGSRTAPAACPCTRPSRPPHPSPRARWSAGVRGGAAAPPPWHSTRPGAGSAGVGRGGGITSCMRVGLGGAAQEGGGGGGGVVLRLGQGWPAAGSFFLCWVRTASRSA